MNIDKILKNWGIRHFLYDDIGLAEYLLENKRENIPFENIRYVIIKYKEAINDSI